VRGVVHHQVERATCGVVIDQAAERGGIGLVDAEVHLDPIAETPLRDQRVEGGYPLLVELHGHEHVGVGRQGHEGATTALVDPDLDDRGRPHVGQERQVGVDQLGSLDQAEPGFPVDVKRLVAPRATNWTPSISKTFSARQVAPPVRPVRVDVTPAAGTLAWYDRTVAAATTDPARAAGRCSLPARGWSLRRSGRVGPSCGA